MEDSTILKIKKMRRKAFSIIELSVVIIVIGLIVALITHSSKLVPKMKLAMARNATAASPVPLMKEVIMWLESTSIKSFADSETDDGLSISTWYDINPIDNVKNNATQSTGGSKPIYVANCINHLPCVRFNGSSTYLNFDGSPIVSSDYSIIIVEQRRSSSSNNYFIAGTGTSTNTNLVLGYRDDTTITFSQYENDFDVTVSEYQSSMPVIHVFTFTPGSKHYYINGTVRTLVANGEADMDEPLQSFSGATLGYSSTASSYYNGDLAEVIILNRLITDDERRAIESYLAKKWKITIS